MAKGTSDFFFLAWLYKIVVVGCCTVSSLTVSFHVGDLRSGVRNGRYVCDDLVRRAVRTDLGSKHQARRRYSM